MKVEPRIELAIHQMYLGGAKLIAVGVGRESAAALEADEADLALQVDTPAAVARILVDAGTGPRQTGRFDPETVSGELLSALRCVVDAAGIIGAAAVELLPADRRQQFRQSLFADQCQLTVQLTWRSGRVHVMADGPRWLAPQLLLALEPPQGDRH